MFDISAIVSFCNRLDLRWEAWLHSSCLSLEPQLGAKRGGGGGGVEGGGGGGGGDYCSRECVGLIFRWFFTQRAEHYTVGNRR